MVTTAMRRILRHSGQRVGFRGGTTHPFDPLGGAGGGREDRGGGGVEGGPVGCKPVREVVRWVDRDLHQEPPPRLPSRSTSGKY